MYPISKTDWKIFANSGRIIKGLFTATFVSMLLGCMANAPHMGHMRAGATTNDYLIYDDNTKIGTIKYRAEIGERNLVFSKIEEVCNSKNVSLQSGTQKPAGGTAYSTFDEEYTNGQFVIKFQCLY